MSAEYVSLGGRDRLINSHARRAAINDECGMIAREDRGSLISRKVITSVAFPPRDVFVSLSLSLSLFPDAETRLLLFRR